MARPRRCRSSSSMTPSATARAGTSTWCARSHGVSRPLESLSESPGAHPHEPSDMSRPAPQTPYEKKNRSQRLVYGLHGTASSFLTAVLPCAWVCVVCSEKAEECGGSVGYQIRLERRTSDRTRLLFCTTGILLRKMQLNPTLQGTTRKDRAPRNDGLRHWPHAPGDPQAPCPPPPLVLCRGEPRDFGRGARAVDRVGLPAHHPPRPAPPAARPQGASPSPPLLLPLPSCPPSDLHSSAC